MKIAITGHTAGLGKAIKETIGKKIVGFSLTNGYDISNPEDRERIYQESLDCDVFINNAYHPTGQLDMLNLLIDRWKDQNKTIINICSTIVFLDPNKIKYNHLRSYSAAKIQQDEICRKNIFTLYPKVINVLPGAMNTQMTDFPGMQIQKMDVYDVAKHILNALNTGDGVETRYIVLKPILEAKNYENVTGD